MAILDQTQGTLELRPERERVCLRVHGSLDPGTLAQLETEARGLMERGFARMAIDLRDVQEAAPATAATLAAISRDARRHQVALVARVAHTGAVVELVQAGLLSGVPIEEPSERTFFDWSR